MIPHGVDVFVSLSPVDLRWSFDRLAGVAREHMGRELRSGALFVFFGKRREALKVLFFDSTGMCLFYKRLDQGTFRLPEPQGEDGTTVVLSERALDDLLDGYRCRGEAASGAARARAHARIEDRFARDGCSVDRGTMCRWVEEAGATAGATVIAAARQEAMSSTFCIATDATGVLVQPARSEDKAQKPFRPIARGKFLPQ